MTNLQCHKGVLAFQYSYMACLLGQRTLKAQRAPLLMLSLLKDAGGEQIPFSVALSVVSGAHLILGVGKVHGRGEKIRNPEEAQVVN